MVEAVILAKWQRLILLFKLMKKNLKHCKTKIKGVAKKEAQRQREKLELEINDFLNYKTPYISTYKIK